MTKKRRQLLKALSDHARLMRKIESAGTPPHTDYWHQSIEDAKAKIEAARA